MKQKKKRLRKILKMNGRIKPLKNVKNMITKISQMKS